MLIRKFKVQSKKRMKFIGIWMVSMMLPSGLHAATWLKNLKVEYRNTPLAVGVMHPRFAWQMEVDDKSRGNLQSAYRISVIDETGKEVWNTGKVKSTESLGIQYAGESLRPSTRYQWHLTVWNQKNEELQASSAFETALVLGTDYNHPVATAGKGTYLAWEGAKWIGRGNAPVMFYAPYFPTFRLHYELQLDKKSKSTAASFIFGANDPRLMDRNKNLLGVSNAKDSSYIRVELDIAPLRKSKPARINFYRRGYKVGETDAAPLVSYDIPAAVINRQNQYAAHQIDISMDTGAATLFLDGKEIVGEKVEIDTDISVFGRSATYITDASQFLRRYLISVRDLQSAKGQYPDVAPTNCGFGGLLWASAGVTLPWELYQQYGDKAMLAEHYASMKRYIQFVLDEYVDKKTGLIVQHHQWGDLGDWLSPSYEKDDKSLVWECYFIFDLDILSQMAKALGKTEDAAWLTRLANERRAFFRKTFVDEATGKTICSWYDAERKGQLIDTQTSYALPLAFHVVDGDLQKKMAAHLAAAIKTPMAGYPAYSLLTGFIGTAWISKALSDNGMSEEAYRLLQYEGYPSWLYPVKNGATTIWERLNSYTVKDGFGENNSMNSFNHYSFGAVASWMYNYSLGICRDEKSPGFKHFILKPEVDPTRGITHAEGYYDSMYGRISSRWQYTDSGIRYEFTVPANTTASLYLPAPAVSFISENGKPLKKASGVRYVSADKELHHLELASGSYQFDIKQK